MFMAMKSRTTRVIIGAAAMVSALTIWFVLRAPEYVAAEYRPDGSFQHYRRALGELGGTESDLGSRWLAAADEAVAATVGGGDTAGLPLAETVIFDPADPEAVVYRFSVPQRREVQVSLETDVDPPLFFADIYRLSANGTSSPLKVASLDRERNVVRIRTRRAGTYLFRLQPEVGRGGRVRVLIEEQ